jgi:deferrochelatase/peroxidase EfeB
MTADAHALRRSRRPPSRRIVTPVTVHALLLLYEKDEETPRPGARRWARRWRRTTSRSSTAAARSAPDERGIAREHFGFADGVSQPAPFESKAVVVKGGADYPKDPWNGVPLGEVLMGHENGHHEIALGPVVATTATKGRKAGLPAHPRGEGFLDLGLDGSYMVVRELKQDVAAFWKSMHAAPRASTSAIPSIRAYRPPNGSPAG